MASLWDAAATFIICSYQHGMPLAWGLKVEGFFHTWGWYVGRHSIKVKSLTISEGGNFGRLVCD